MPIATRLLLASALLLPLALGSSGLVLIKAFENSLLEAQQARLRGHIFLLFSAAELAENPGADQTASIEMPSALMEPDFERLNSGLYAYIYNREGRLVWRSNSAELMPLPDYRSLARQQQPGELIQQQLPLDDTVMFSAHYDVIWEDSRGEDHPFRFAVLRERDDFKASLSAYRHQAWRWLGAAALALLLTQAAIVRWGLNPLERLSRALEAMHAGKTRNLSGNHPRELQRLVDSLNRVLEREDALRQGYRNSLGNLAHSLKTPLAVVQARVNDEVQDPALKAQLQEQLARMNQVISYQLQRPLSREQQGLRQKVPVEQSLERLLRSLDKVYADKGVTWELEADHTLNFSGDPQDLLEVLGNLLDNAYKYGRNRLRITARREEGCLKLWIEDNGPGIPPEQREQLGQRGLRLDSRQSGQGIGLAVAVDIVASYGGRLDIGESELGGASFRLELPLEP